MSTNQIDWEIVTGGELIKIISMKRLGDINGYFLVRRSVCGMGVHSRP